MGTVLAWLIIGTLALAAFTFLVLAPLAWIVGNLAKFLNERSEPHTVPVRFTDVQATAPVASRVDNPGTAFDSNDNDLEFAKWAQAIIPHTKKLSDLMGRFRPAIESDDEAGICATAGAIVAELDLMESVLLPPPNAEAEVHWAAMTSLLRQSCTTAIEGVQVTRTLSTASHYLNLANAEMTALARIMNEWADSH